jgi:hypothetical protein
MRIRWCDTHYSARGWDVGIGVFQRVVISLMCDSREALGRGRPSLDWTDESICPYVDRAHKRVRHYVICIS